MRFFIIVLMYALTACSHQAVNEQQKVTQSSQPNVDSYKNLFVSEFNKAIAMALAEGQDWPFSPALVVFNIVGGDKETRTFELIQEANSVDTPSMVTSVLIRDGFPDDSVRGDWHKITLSKNEDNAWHVVEIQKAHNCWRAKKNDYSSSPCP